MRDFWGQNWPSIVQTVDSKDLEILIKVYKLPNTMDLTFLGDYMFTNDYTSAIVYKPNSKAIYHITLFDSYQLVELKLDNKIIIIFKDIIIDSNNLNSIKKNIDSKKYIFENK